MRDLDAVLHDLNAVRAEILELSDAQFAERAALEAKRESLRAEARRINAAADPGAAARSLRSELVELEKSWDRLAAERIDVVKQAGGGSTGGDFAFAADAQRINFEIDRAAGRAGIEARIRTVRALLAELEGEGGSD